MVRDAHVICAFPVFPVPKPDGTVRPIIDFSAWTPYIHTPRFSLHSAGTALKSIPHKAFLIKIDLQSGFHQLKIDPSTGKFNGVYHNRVKYRLTRLPMGHALAPGVFQRFSDVIIRHIYDVLEVRGVAYLDDWLFYHEDGEELLRVPDYITHMGITINRNKSVLQPTRTLTYLDPH